MIDSLQDVLNDSRYIGEIISDEFTAEEFDKFVEITMKYMSNDAELNVIFSAAATRIIAAPIKA